MKDKLTELRDMRAKAKLGGGQARIDDQHGRGKLTARERIEALSIRAPSRNWAGSRRTTSATSAWPRSASPATAS